MTKSPKPGSPVCPDCQRIYKNLKKGWTASGFSRRAVQAAAPAMQMRFGR